MNVVLFITDQERAIQHFPPDWARNNLPGLTQLQATGLTFNNAFTNACMCSPARSTLMTGYFPAQHGVKWTLEEDMPNSSWPQPQPQLELSTELKNIATVMSAAGYNVVYKGKFHCNKPAASDGVWVPSDLEKYGFTRWNPKDAGANQDLDQGGGNPYPGGNNDDRFMNEVGDVATGHEGALQYLNTQSARSQPFFMIISLVNPHDVLFYPTNFDDSGYDPAFLQGDLQLPPTSDEDLATKPSVQAEFIRIFNLRGRLNTREQKLAYLNFYGNLMKASDAYLVDTLAALQANGLLDNTLVIRTADHGEMGLAHGGMRQKNFNFYEESLRVPLVFSNPRLYPEAVSSDALVSHVDFLPTIASLFNAPDTAKTAWQGVDYSRQVLKPTSKPAQDYIVFTYDDYQSGQKTGPYPSLPNRIVSIREARWKLAEYYDPDGKVASQFEMYDLKADPNETTNLAHESYRRTPAQNAQYKRLRKKLADVEATRLQPL